jgi:inorganic pyrophosphatase/exopolyphosphatase
VYEIAREHQILTLCPLNSVKLLSQDVDLKQTSSLTIVRKDFKCFPPKGITEELVAIVENFNRR